MCEGTGWGELLHKAKEFELHSMSVGVGDVDFWGKDSNMIMCEKKPDNCLGEIGRIRTQREKELQDL